jgi:hypothetical protein
MAQYKPFENGGYLSETIPWEALSSALCQQQRTCNDYRNTVNVTEWSRVATSVAKRRGGSMFAPHDIV